MLSEKEQTNDIAAFWRFVKFHLRQLILFALFGGLLAYGITFFIPKEYKSYGIVYPPSSTSIENSIDFPNFGYDVEADRLMQIIESREIRDSVIAHFNLTKYFNIDTINADWHDDLLRKYYKNIKLERTTSMAVLITARTEDPVMCANIVNFIINSADHFREKLYKRNIGPAYEQALAEYEFQKHRSDSIEFILQQHLKEKKLSSLLVLVSEAQITVDLDKLNAAAGTEGIGEELIAFKSQNDVMKEAKSRMIKTKKTLQNPIPKIYVVNYAEPHYKKISPSFFVNSAIGALMALFISIIIILIGKKGATF